MELYVGESAVTLESTRRVTGRYCWPGCYADIVAIVTGWE